MNNLIFFQENGFGIKKPAKADMPLNKENKTRLFPSIYRSIYLSQSFHTYISIYLYRIRQQSWILSNESSKPNCH